MTTNIGISLGWNCHSAMWGVSNNIRDRKENGYNTCPFDIMVTNYPGICECINDDFKHLCDEKYLEIIKSPIFFSSSDQYNSGSQSSISSSVNCQNLRICWAIGIAKFFSLYILK